MSFTLHLNLAAPLSAAATAQAHAFPDKGSLQAALARWCAEPESDKSLGPISSWNVTAVTDMEGLVSNMAEHDCAATFNEVQHPHTARPRLKIHLQPPLCSHAHPRCAATPRSHLSAPRSSSQDIDDWDVGRVTSMGSMFSYCSSFNQPLNSWNVARVTNLQQLFYAAKAFTLVESGQPQLPTWCLLGLRPLLRTPRIAA